MANDKIAEWEQDFLKKFLVLDVQMMVDMHEEFGEREQLECILEKAMDLENQMENLDNFMIEFALQTDETTNEKPTMAPSIPMNLSRLRKKDQTAISQQLDREKKVTWLLRSNSSFLNWTKTCKPASTRLWKVGKRPKKLVVITGVDPWPIDSFNLFYKLSLSIGVSTIGCHFHSIDMGTFNIVKRGSFPTVHDGTLAGRTCRSWPRRWYGIQGEHHCGRDAP
ncbi:hypothetical protein ACLOJK_038977 [Asimina triloba]